MPDHLKAPPLTHLGELVAWCTKINPKDRPTAEQVLKFDLFSSSKVADMQESVIRNLELELNQKIEENERLRRIIERQTKQLENHKLISSSNEYRVDCAEKNDEDDY